MLVRKARQNKSSQRRASSVPAVFHCTLLHRPHFRRLSLDSRAEFRILGRILKVIFQTMKVEASRDMIRMPMRRHSRVFHLSWLELNDSP